MENRAYALAAGVFVLLLGAAAVFGLWWFGERDQPQADYLVTTRGNITGLNREGNVRYRGLLVGKVKSIRLNESDPRETLIRIRVSRDVPITQATRAQLAYQGVTGIAHILLTDVGQPGAPLVAERGALPRIPMDASFLDRLGDAGGNVIQQSGELMLRLQRLIDDENQASIRAILGNLDRLTAHLADSGGRIEPLLVRLDAVLADSQALLAPENQQRLGRGMAAIERAAGSVETAFARWQRLADDYSALARRLDEAAQRATGAQGIGGAAAEVRRVAAELEAGSRRLSRLLAAIEENPNALLVGAPVIAPGPGEAGFRAPPARGEAP
jgi:phospholipid/cholesterol/gamma-HCH transport system substrate-binding protein